MSCGSKLPRQARQSPLDFNLNDLAVQVELIFHASLGGTLAGQGMPVSAYPASMAGSDVGR